MKPMVYSKALTEGAQKLAEARLAMLRQVIEDLRKEGADNG
jgi:hypothetical protein